MTILQRLATLNAAQPRLVPAALALASIGVLLAALFFQYVLGYLPCILCIYQRWAYVAALLLALLAAALPGQGGLRRGLLILSGLAFTVGAAVAAFQVGVEQHWWIGTPECGGTIGAQTVEELKAQLLRAPVVRCDEVQWSLFGISMAGYNIVISLGLAVIAVVAATAGRQRRNG